MDPPNNFDRGAPRRLADVSVVTERLPPRAPAHRRRTTVRPAIRVPRLLWAVVDVLQIAIVGDAIGSVLGVLLGLVTGLWEPAENVISPILDGLYVVPVTALVRLIIIWFGLNSTAKIFLVILFCIFVVAFNTEEGV